MLQKDGTYKTILGKKEVKIHPSSVLFSKKAPFVVFHELASLSFFFLFPFFLSLLFSLNRERLDAHI